MSTAIRKILVDEQGRGLAGDSPDPAPLAVRRRTDAVRLRVGTGDCAIAREIPIPPRQPIPAPQAIRRKPMRRIVRFKGRPRFRVIAGGLPTRKRKPRSDAA